MPKNSLNKRVDRMARREERRKHQTNSRKHPDLSLVGPEDNVFQLENKKADKTPLTPRNENQAQYLNALRHKDLIISTGSAGTGKTFLAGAYAADELRDKEYEKIIVTRPVLQADEDLGFLPGTVNEKFAPYFRPVYDVLLKRMGAGFMQYCLRPEVDKVEIAPFAYMRGRTFENAIVILDEAQNVTVNQMKLFLTRIGENTKVIINGDVNQCDLPVGVPSGLADLLNRAKDSDVATIIRFTDADCVRSDICKYALDLYS